MTSNLYVPQPKRKASRASIDSLDVAEQSVSMKQSNTRTIACCLPFELIAEIFLLAQKDWLPRRIYGRSGGPIRYGAGWLAILRVCSGWRKFALSIPELWRSVPVLDMHPDYSQHFLACSAGLNLSINLNDANGTFGWKFDSQDGHTMQHISIWFSAFVFRRVEKLDIFYDGRQDFWSTLLTNDAPNFRYFVFGGGGGGPGDVPSNVLGSTYPPLLRRLSLSKCHRISTFPLFTPALTHLKLSLGSLATESGQSSVARLLSVIATMHSLEYLYLESFYESKESAVQLEKVNLPSTLDYMALQLHIKPGDSWKSLIDMSEHLSAPATTDVHVIVHLGSMVDEILFNRLFRYVLDDGTENDLLYELELNSMSQWQLYRWDPSANSRVDKRCVNLSPAELKSMDILFLLLVCPYSLVVSSDYWREFAEAHARDPVRNPWAHVFFAAKDVRSLTIYYRDYAHLCFVLRARPLLFPNLDVIVLSDVVRFWAYLDKFDPSDTTEFTREGPETVKSEVDAGLLESLVEEITQATVVTEDDYDHILEVRVEGSLGEWDGWDGLREAINVTIV